MAVAPDWAVLVVEEGLHVWLHAQDLLAVWRCLDSYAFAVVYSHNGVSLWLVNGMVETSFALTTEQGHISISLESLSFASLAFNFISGLSVVAWEVVSFLIKFAGVSLTFFVLWALRLRFFRCCFNLFGLLLCLTFYCGGLNLSLLSSRLGFGLFSLFLRRSLVISAESKARHRHGILSHEQVVLSWQ